MDRHGYKASKEAFVSGTTGSTVLHVNLISSVALCSLALYSSLRKRYTASKQFAFIFEWTLLVLPLLLSMTLFADMPQLLCTMLLLPVLLLHTFSGKRNKDPTPSLNPQAIAAPALSHMHSIDISPGRDETRFPPAHRIVLTPIPALTVYRAHMLLMTFLAILAVDFPVFPRSLAKCETFGVSLMDLGVGSFVFSQGIVSAIPMLKDPGYLLAPPFSKLSMIIKKVLPLFFLGIVRVVSIKGTDYPEHESEYGTHWNFFFTLAVLPVLQVVLHPVIVQLPISFLGFMVALFHQVLLMLTPLQMFALNAPRTSLVSANKEGLVSLTGYLAIHLLGLSAGTMILPPSPSEFRKQQRGLQQQLRAGNPSSCINGNDATADRRYNHTKILERQNDKTAVELLSYAILWWTSLGICHLLSIGGGVSRRLANFPYVTWVAAYNTSILAAYSLLDMFYLSSKKPKVKDNHLLHPEASHSADQASASATYMKTRAAPLFGAINRNGFPLFLLANVATGLVNFMVPTMYTSDTTAMVVLSVYSLGLCMAAWMFKDTRLWKL